MNYDCIICGAGPSGIVAALSAKRNGANVLLIENTALLGGTNVLSLVGPLMTFHNQDRQVIGGIASEIIDRLVAKKKSFGHLPDPLGFCSTVTPYDYEALKALYFKMIIDEKIEILLHTRIINVMVENGVIQAVTVCNQNGIYNIYGKIFIDATGDGEVCKLAGAKYTVGRNPDHLCQPMTMPFVVGNVNLESLRLSMKENPNNFVLNQNYDFHYIGISGFFEEIANAKRAQDFNINRDRVLLFENVNKDEVTINMTRVLKLSPLDVYDHTKAEIEGRKQIVETFAFLKKYIPGFENSYIVATPYQIGIRESRHIECDYVMTQDDIAGLSHFMDSIAIGAFPMDIHSPSGDKMEIPLAKENKAYEIPLRVLFPVGLTNIIVTGRAIGATHEASASLRVTPIAMSLGQTAGTLAALAIQKKQNIRDIDIHNLQQILIEQGMKIKI